MVGAFLTLLVSLTSQLLASDTATILFAGDAMQHQRQLDAACRPDGVYDYTECFAATAPYVRAADYAVVNLETPLGGAPYSGYPMFCAPDSYLDALVDAGFDFFLGANNHALDRRDRGVRRTVDRFIARGLPFAGIYRNAAMRDSVMPRIVNVKGFRIGILNYTYGTNGIEIREDVVVDPIAPDLIARDIEAARKGGAELIAACIHWGDEYHLLPNSSQKRLADRLAALGVDMVIGGHPHVIQPMELRVDSVTGKRCFVVYSLGNFISAMRTTDTRGGALARVTLSRDDAGCARVESACYRLVFVETPQARSSHNFRLRPAETPIVDNPMAESQRKAFVASAERIFSRRNINVPRDTVQCN